MSDWTPLTQQEIYQKSLDEAQGEPLVPETRLEYFLNKIAEGGGGNSDFSTAHMTVNVGGDGLKYCPTPLITENAIEIIYPNENTGIADDEYDVPLYNGELVVETGCSSITVSGDAEFDGDEGLLIITGDCEITAFTANEDSL